MTNTELRELIRFFVAGVQHSDYTSLTEEPKSGDEVIIIPEPENQYDSGALRLELHNIKIGYVPKSINRYVACGGDKDNPLVPTAKLLNYYPDKPAHRAFEVAVYVSKPEDKGLPIPDPDQEAEDEDSNPL